MWTEPAPVQSSPVQKSGPALGPDCGPDLRSGSLDIHQNDENCLQLRHCLLVGAAEI
jgi:hypothetical protein